MKEYLLKEIIIKLALQILLLSVIATAIAISLIKSEPYSTYEKLHCIVFFNILFIIAYILTLKFDFKRKNEERINMKNEALEKKFLLEALNQENIKIYYEDKDICFIIEDYKKPNITRNTGKIIIYKCNDIYMKLPYYKFLKYVKNKVI